MLFNTVYVSFCLVFVVRVRYHKEHDHKELLQMNQEVSYSVSQKHDIIVHGETLNNLPADLYIPPDALRIFLETFQGPLDLLLYLIKKQHIDILNIPIKTITMQYMQYVEMMQSLQLELAAEYLLMAAMLAEIKSRLLLPQMPSDELEEGIDPRAALIQRLQQYERFKKAAENLESLPQVGRDVFVSSVDPPPMNCDVSHPEVSKQDLLNAFVDVMTRARLFADHKIEKEILSIRERMLRILDRINNTEKFIIFTDFFDPSEGRMGVVVTLIAILELVRQSTLEFVQAKPFAPIYVKIRTAVSE